VSEDGSTAVSAWESLFRAQVSVLRVLQREFPKGPVSFAEYDVLFNLSRQEGRAMRIRDLNRQLLISQPSVSRMVDRLASRGLVRKESDPDDGRGTVVRLTDDGYSLFRRVAAAHSDSIRRHLGGALTAQELDQLKQLSDRLRARIEFAD
jgi:DNA-binding MarR family transcriptional regulator